jgi:hypothetical protein
MTNFDFPIRRRAGRWLLRQFNSAAQVCRAPFWRPSVVLVTGNASEAKALEAEKRLRFLIDHLGMPLGITRTRAASPLAYLRSAAVAAVDAAALPVLPRRLLQWVANIDYETNPREGWELIELGEVLAHRQVRVATASGREVFLKHVRSLQSTGERPAYLFGTGPSLQAASQRSFADGVTIVCNTIVRDPKLWHHLQPAFLAAGDAIYHFGQNPHAEAFRADALQRLRESNGQTLFVYPAQYDIILRSEFAEVESLLIPIPFGEHTDVSVDLTRRYAIPQLDNVLTALLLPLGCTVSRDVRLWGFDGRAPNNEGFWANSGRQSYSELMQSIRDSHPAFFASTAPEGLESQYVERVHGALLDERLSDAESRGFQFHMLHHSWTPTLLKRFAEPEVRQ